MPQPFGDDGDVNSSGDQQARRDVPERVQRDLVEAEAADCSDERVVDDVGITGTRTVA